MESRKLGNKTKIIKLMSKVGNYWLIIITTSCIFAIFSNIFHEVLKFF